MNAVDSGFKERVVTTFRAMKLDFDIHPDELSIPVHQQGRAIVRLRPVHVNFIPQEITLLMEWRNQNREAFFSWFVATEQGTRDWLKEQILSREDRILFFVETLDGVPFGHIGLTSFDFSSKTCEIDNVLRGRDEFIKGGMSAALRALIDWVFIYLGANSVYLRVLADNRHAVDFYESSGLRIVKRAPLRRVEAGNIIRWVEADNESASACENYALYLERGNDVNCAKRSETGEE